MPSSFNPLYAVMHIKEAKAAAVNLSRKVFKRKEASTRTNTNPEVQMTTPTRIPAKRNMRWLQLVNEVSKQGEIKQKDDFRKVVEKANHLHRTQKDIPSKGVRESSSTFESR